MANWSNWNFLLEATLNIKNQSHMFGTSAENTSVHWDRSRLATYADGDNSIRRVFTSCQSLSRAYISTDVTTDVSYKILTLEYWNLHEYVQNVL